jgi:hypothetical protein
MSPPRAAASALSIFFPVEVYPVIAPVVLAGGLFSYMMTRTFVSDPDTKHNVNMPIDCSSSRAYGEMYRQTVRGWFADRIKAQNYHIFDNGSNAMPLGPRTI